MSRRVERSEDVMHNAWVIAGTRIPIKAIRNFHQAGYSHEQIIVEYPDLTIADIEAALDFKPPREPKPTTLDRFAEGLKARLRSMVDWDLVEASHNEGIGMNYVLVKRAELERAIDEFCAEFKGK